MAFDNPIVAANGALAMTSVHSPNYLPAVSGWTINKDGTVEFNTLGGTLQVNNLGLFFYVPSPGSGNLLASFTDVGGTDLYGNQYIGGFFLNQHQTHITGDNSDTVIINPDGALGPEIQFAEAGFPFATHLIQFANELRAEAINGSGALFRINMPVLATGGYQGSSSSPVAQPPWNVLGSMVDFAANKWAGFTMLCPPSETVEIDINCVGFNNNSTTSTLSIAVGVKAGATVIVAPTQYLNSATITPEGAAAASVAMHQKFRRYTVGQDKLGGFSGQTLTFTPAWQISSGSAASASIDNTASIAVRPSLFTQFQSG